MLLNWLANAVAVRLGLTPDAVAAVVNKTMDARRDVDAKHVRELISEMDDTMEKFSRVVAREGMRRTRAMKAAMEEEVLEKKAAEPQDDVLPLDQAGRKSRLRMKAQREGLM